jgi:hypothetical protein
VGLQLVRYQLPRVIGARVNYVLAYVTQAYLCEGHDSDRHGYVALLGHVVNDNVSTSMKELSWLIRVMCQYLG